MNFGTEPSVETLFPIKEGSVSVALQNEIVVGHLYVNERGQVIFQSDRAIQKRSEANVSVRPTTAEERHPSSIVYSEPDQAL